MEDQFADFATNLTSPATNAETVTPSDSTNLTYTCRAIYVGSSGDAVVEMASGSVVTLSNLAAGVIYPLRIVGVRATGTTAQDLVALR